MGASVTVAVLAACGGKDAPAPVCAVTAVSVIPTTASLAVGETVTLNATVAQTNCTALATTWSSSNTAVASVSSTGVVTGVAAGGPVLITATAGTVSGSAAVSVTVPAIATITLAIANANLVETQTTQVTATLRDARGNALTGRALTWSSSNTAAATVDGSGLVTAVGAGTSTITARDASNSATSGTVAVTVAARAPSTISFVNAPTAGQIGVPISLTVQVKDQLGSVMADRQVLWSISDAGLATVGPGSTWTRCAIEGATCTVSGTKLVRYGATTGLYFYKQATGSVECTNAVFGDAAANISKVCDYADRLTNVGVATLRPLGAGNIVVTVSSTDNAAIQATAPITIAPTGKVWRLAALGGTFDPIRVGTSRTVAVFPLDSTNDELKLEVTAVSSNPAVVSVSKFLSNSFQLTGVSAGTANITFLPPTGVTGTFGAPITITAATIPVASVAVSLNSSSLTAGQTTQATATTRDASNNVLTGRTVAWTSSNTAVATVNATSGVVTAVNAGTANIVATSEGVTGTAPLTVTAVAAPVASVTVAVGIPNLTIGQTTQATATTRDAGGNVLTGRTITWSSSNTAVATVNSNSGLVTAVSAGTANITATSEGVTGSATITVTAASVRLAYAMVNPGGTIVPDFTNNLAGGAPTVEYGLPALAVGTYRVTFPGMTATGNQSDYYHATPAMGSYCTVAGADNVGANLRVIVNCWALSNGLLVPGPAGFSVMAVGNGVFGGRSSFAFANQPSSAGPYSPPAGLGFTSAGVQIQLRRSGTGTYTANTGLFPRTTGREVPLVGAIGVASSAIACESQGIDVFGGSGLEDIQCRGVNNSLADASYMSLIFSQGRPNTAWGFAYFPQNVAFDPTPFRLQSDGAGVTIASNGAGGQRVTFSALPTTGPRLLQIMPNFNGFATPARWVTCGYTNLNIPAKTYDVHCHTSLGATVGSDFVIIVAQ